MHACVRVSPRVALAPPCTLRAASRIRMYTAPRMHEMTMHAEEHAGTSQRRRQGCARTCASCPSAGAGLALGIFLAQPTQAHASNADLGALIECCSEVCCNRECWECIGGCLRENPRLMADLCDCSCRCCFHCAEGAKANPRCSACGLATACCCFCYAKFQAPSALELELNPDAADGQRIQLPRLWDVAAVIPRRIMLQNIDQPYHLRLRDEWARNGGGLRGLEPTAHRRPAALVDGEAPDDATIYAEEKCPVCLCQFDLGHPMVSASGDDTPVEPLRLKACGKLICRDCHGTLRSVPRCICGEGRYESRRHIDHGTGSQTLTSAQKEQVRRTLQRGAAPALVATEAPEDTTVRRRGDDSFRAGRALQDL